MNSKDFTKNGRELICTPNNSQLARFVRARDLSFLSFLSFSQSSQAEYASESESESRTFSFLAN